MLQDQTLHLLEKSRGKIVTGGELARQLGVSRTAIWKAINALREKGNDIQSIPNSGYRLAMDSDGLSEQGIREYLTTGWSEIPMEVLPIVNSTNQYLKSLDAVSLPEGYMVAADEQSDGRGRFGRTFHSPAREGAYFSMLLRPPIPLTDAPLLTICAAVAVCEALEAVCGLEPGIKWVNDVFCNGKKICGILTEAFVTAETQAIDYAIVGIGVNMGRIAPEIAEIATSVRTLTGKRGLRNRLIADIRNRFATIYGAFVQNNCRQSILAAYANRLFIIGSVVEVVQPDARYDATVQGINDSGALLVRTAAGADRVVRTGEIHLKHRSCKQ